MGRGAYGTENGLLRYPHGIDVDDVGDVYVTDYGNHRIQKFTSTGEFITTWGGLGSADGEFNNPESIAVNTNGEVYVADSNNAPIQKFIFIPNGDFNDLETVAEFAENFGRTNCGSDCENDVDMDGDVDGSDLADLSS